MKISIHHREDRQEVLQQKNNIVGVSFGHASNHKNDHQSWWCHVQCLHAAVYMEWLNKSAHILDGELTS